MILLPLLSMIVLGLLGITLGSRRLMRWGLIGTISTLIFLILRPLIIPALMAGLLFAGVVAICIWAEHKMNDGGN